MAIKEVNIMNIEEYREAVENNRREIAHLNQELQNLAAEANRMSQEEYNRELENINNHLNTEQERLSNNSQIVNEYDRLRANIMGLRNLESVTPRDESDIAEINNERQEREREIQESRNIVPEELQEALRNEILGNNTATPSGTSSPEPSDNSEPSDNQESASGVEEVGETPAETSEPIDLFNPDLDYLNVPENEWNPSFRKAAKENQENEEKMNYLNNMNQQRKKRKKEDHIMSDEHFNDNFLYDENGNMVINENSGKPMPRYRGMYESPEDYEKFLEDYYNDIFPIFDRKDVREKYGIPDFIPKQNNSFPQLPNDLNKRPLDLPSTDVRSLKGLPGPTKKPDLSPIEGTINKPEPTPTKEPEPVPTKKGPTSTKEQPKKENRRTLEEILQEVCQGLEILPSDNRKYKASKIHAAYQLKEELKTGQVLYNIVRFAPALVSATINTIKKLISLPKTKKTKERLEKLRRRIYALPREDMEVVRDELILGKANEKRIPSAVLTIFNERIQEMANEDVARINNKITKDFSKAFGDFRMIEAINKKLQEGNLSQEERTKLETTRAKLYQGKAKLIERIRNNQQAGAEILTGGAEGFSRDVKAAQTKMNVEGRIRAKNPIWDDELGEKEAILSKAEKLAIDTKDDQKALDTFITWERLKSENTNIKKTILGEKSIGSRYYTPLIGRMDYRDDPLLRDVLTTIALTSAAISAANAVKTHLHDDQQLLAGEQARANAVNKHNQDTMDQVHQTGEDIVGKRGDFQDGMKAHAYEDVNNYGNVRERADLDNNGWAIGSSGYRQADTASHAATHQMFENTRQRIEDIAMQEANGQLTAQQAMEEFAKVSNANNQTFYEALVDRLPTFQQYAQNHPGIDMHGYNEAINSLVNNPDAILNMNQGMVDVVNMGESLTGLTMEQMEVLKSLPSDLGTTLTAAAASASLASKVANTTQANFKQGKYGNAVTQMVEESYANQKNAQAETTRSK